MLINGSASGASAVGAGQVIRLPNGMVGYTWARNYRLDAPTESNRFHVLQSLDSPELAFLVSDPFSLFPDYEIELSTEEAKFLGIEKSEDAAVLVTVALSEGFGHPVANLMAPIVVNMASGVAKQVALQDSTYEARTPMNAFTASASPVILREAA